VVTVTDRVRRPDYDLLSFELELALEGFSILGSLLWSRSVFAALFAPQGEVRSKKLGSSISTSTFLHYYARRS
jgi:hypothetical protein